MGKVKVLNKKEKLAFAVVAALAMTSGGFAFGQSVNNVSSDQVIYACVTGVNGNITKVSNTPKTCPKGTTPISWNMVGPKGDQGIQGIKGDQGIQGLKGDPGASTSSETPQFTLVGPNGEKYKITSGIWGTNLVFIGGHFWNLGYEGLGPLGSEMAQPPYFYSSSDCNSNPIFVASNGMGFIPSGAYQLDPILNSPLNVYSELDWNSNNKAYEVINRPRETLHSVKSVLIRNYEEEVTRCINLDLQSYFTSLQAFASKVRNSLTNQSASLIGGTANFMECSLVINYSDGPANISQSFTGCLPANLSDSDKYYISVILGTLSSPVSFRNSWGTESNFTVVPNSSGSSHFWIQNDKSQLLEVLNQLSTEIPIKKYLYEANYIGDSPNISVDSGWYVDVKP